MKYNVTVFGNKTTTADLVRHLKNDGHDISLIVTLSKNAEATKSIAGADDLAELARVLSIPVYETEDYKLTSAADKKFFAENSFGIGLCTGWQRLLPEHVLAAFPAGVFGFHGSCWKLPEGRGRSPLNWSVRKGGDRIFHNCFRYVAAADAGEIYNTTEFPISRLDNISSVQFKALLDMKMVSSRLLKDYKAGSVKTVSQPEAATSWLGKLDEKDGLIRFGSMASAEIINLVNATSRPFPGAFAVSADDLRTLRIWRAMPFEFPFAKGTVLPEPGTVMDCSLGQVLIRCKDGFILASDYDFTATQPGVALAAGCCFI